MAYESCSRHRNAIHVRAAEATGLNANFGIKRTPCNNLNTEDTLAYINRVTAKSHVLWNRKSKKIFSKLTALQRRKK